MMIDTANQISIDARVTTLADKLGIERHELWLAIVRQAYVEAWTDVAFAVLGLIMAVLGVVLFFKVIKPYGDERRSARYEDWPVLAIVGSFLCGATLVAGVVLLFVNAYNAAQILPNPIYYAYTHLAY